MTIQYRKLLAYFLFFLPLFTHAQGPQLTPLDDGLVKLQKGDYPAAAKQLGTALEKEPENYAANLGLGIALRETGHLDSALPYFDHAIKINATAEAYFNRAALFYMIKSNARGDKDEQTAIHIMGSGPDRMYELRGFYLLQKHDYKKAIPLLDSAIAENKRSYKAYVNKASALNEMKKYEEALATLDQVITLKPDYFNARYDRAQTFVSLGDFEQALTECNKLLDLNAASVDALILRADIKDRLGDDPGATEDCTQAIAIDPNNAKAYNMRALTRFDAHAYQEIIADCNKAIALKPDFYNPYIQRGDAYDDLGEYDKAIADYQKAISIDPTQLQAYRECAASVARKNDFKACLYYLNKGLEIDPGNIYLLDHKFHLQAHTGDIKGALATLDQCIKYRPDSPAIYYIQKVNLYDSLHDIASACKFAFEALKGNATDGYEYIAAHPCTAYKKHPIVLAHPYIIEGQENYAKGMFSAEVASFTKAIALLPDSPMLYYNRGGAKRKLNDFAGAIMDYNKAISLRPKWSEAIAARAVAETYLNNIDAAKKDYELIIKTDPAYTIAYHNYAILLVDSDPTAALDYLTKAIRYNKKYTTAYLTRAKLYQRLGKKEEACADFKRAAALGSDEANIEARVNCK